jgi:hypothetical protein
MQRLRRCVGLVPAPLAPAFNPLSPSASLQHPRENNGPSGGPVLQARRSPKARPRPDVQNRRNAYVRPAELDRRASSRPHIRARLLRRRSDAAPRECDDLLMSGRDDGSFEKKVRAIVTDLSESVEGVVKSIDLDEIARQIEIGGERLREFADVTGRWISDRLSDPEAHHAAQAPDLEPESAARTLPRPGPHPLDLPSDEQGRALSALDSGRCKVEPGTDELVGEGGGSSPTDPGEMVGELRARDWIAANGEVTVIGREALKRWSEGSTGTENGG